MLYTSGGRTSEILVVISPELWEGPLGDTLKSLLGDVPPWLGVYEPEYILSHIPYKIFDNIYQKQRNILFIKKNDLEMEKIVVKRNVYAKPQSFISLQATSVPALISLLSKNIESIKAIFHQNEIDRIATAYRGLEVKSLTMEQQKILGFSLVLPKGFYIAKKDSTFIWLRRPTQDVEEGLMFYTQPYTDTTQFTMESIIAKRNEITKKYIPGPVENSFMKVSSYFPPVSQRINFKGNYTSELRSYWDVEGYLMGGPFISYSFVDTANQRLITIDGYIKAPKKDKRDLIIRLEALFSTFEFGKAVQQK